jgi:CxxC-x17-CxxC domain-containing protein
MGDFKKKQKGFGGGHGGGFDRRDGGRQNFDRPSRGGGRDRGMHRAICAQCGNACEVPFRPVDGRPVYCGDCFRNKKNSGFGGSDKFAPRNFSSPKPDFRPEYGGGAGKGSDSELKKQLEMLNAKMDRLIKVMEAMGNPVNAEAEVLENFKAVPVNAFSVTKNIKAVKKTIKKASKKTKK